MLSGLPHYSGIIPPQHPTGAWRQPSPPDSNFVSTENGQEMAARHAVEAVLDIAYPSSGKHGKPAESRSTCTLQSMATMLMRPACRQAPWIGSSWSRSR
jgi:hypothetical protein